MLSCYYRLSDKVKTGLFLIDLAAMGRHKTDS